MIFSFSSTPDFDFLTHFARHLGAAVENNLLQIPAAIGEGYIRKLTFGPDFKVTLHHYTLKEDLVIKRNSSGLGNELITIFFYSNEDVLEIAFNNGQQVRFSEREDAAIQVTSNDLNSTIRFPAGHAVHYIVIAIKPAYLKVLLNISEPNTVIQTITDNGSSFLYFESMTAEAKNMLKHMAAVNMRDDLSHFYIQVKIQELIYLLFRQLTLRENTHHYSVNSADVERLLFIRNELLKDLSVPPVLNELAQLAAMSETKLKQLFKQTFGDTVYNYFQRARMEEAAFLLKQGKRSVAETGYELGFSNLSHFSRLFEKHYSITPKRYSTQT
ncbi:helix-turn-helix transcriptional regulator [Mucilaginibacter ximonensis]|uniref:Helix-turn-helix transcriptional regulator n=1 Tax=Mucilaginibacter ximonensis TaxID=538021 RepID=A0ABW5YD93_9SPHI